MCVKAIKNSFGKYKLVEPCTVSARRTVPSYIPKPCYAESSVPRDSPKTAEIKTSNQIECMSHSCTLAKRILNQIPALIKVKYIKIKILKNSRYGTSGQVQKSNCSRETSYLKNMLIKFLMKSES